MKQMKFIPIEQRKVRLILFPDALCTFRRSFAIPEKRSDADDHRHSILKKQSKDHRHSILRVGTSHAHSSAYHSCISIYIYIYIYI